MTKGPEDPEKPSPLREIGLGVLGGIVLGPLLLIEPELQPYRLRVLAAALLGGACAGWLHYRTRAWPGRWPPFAPWRGVLVAAAAAQIVGVLATLLGLAPVAALPLWSVGGGIFVVARKLRESLLGREEWTGVTARGVGVAILVAGRSRI